MADPAPSRIFAPGLLAGQVCAVSGAGTGLGRAAAIELARLGAVVAGCGRRREPLAETVEAIRAAGGEASFEPLDIRDADAVERFIEAILERQGASTSSSTTPEASSSAPPRRSRRRAFAR